jgi:hypothetical protein
VRDMEEWTECKKGISWTYRSDSYVLCIALEKESDDVYYLAINRENCIYLGNCCKTNSQSTCLGRIVRPSI